MSEYWHLTLLEMCEGGSQQKASFTGHEIAYMNLTQLNNATVNNDGMASTATAHRPSARDTSVVGLG